MKLIDTEYMVKDLEKGIGDAHWIYNAFAPSLRLRSPVCGLTSTAMSEHLRQQGFDVEMVVSTPRLSADPEMQHVVSLLHHDGEDIVIDGTYSQFLSYSGLTPAYVMNGGMNQYPQQKIASYILQEPEELIDTLVSASREVIDTYNPIIMPYFSARAFKDLSNGEIRYELGKIWDPNNFDTFKPTQDTLRAGIKIARSIVPRHVKLVA